MEVVVETREVMQVRMLGFAAVGAFSVRGEALDSMSEEGARVGDMARGEGDALVSCAMVLLYVRRLSFGHWCMLFSFFSLLSYVIHVRCPKKAQRHTQPMLTAASTVM